MTYNSFLNELVAYGAFVALAGGALLLLVLHILLRRDVQRRLQAMSRTVRKSEESCRQSIAALEEAVRARPVAIPPPAPEEPIKFQPQVERLEEQRPDPPALRKRVLDMNSAGLDPAAIASSLSMRENEVRLMLKVHNAMRSCFSAN